jgi:hypothetical protein
MSWLLLDLARDAAAWDRFVSRHHASSAYHRWAWRDVFASAFGHESLYLQAQDATGIVGVLPLVEFRSPLFGTFAVSLPFLNYGGIVADSCPVAQALRDRAATLATERQWRHVESG